MAEQKSARQIGARYISILVRNLAYVTLRKIKPFPRVTIGLFHSCSPSRLFTPAIAIAPKRLANFSLLEI
jgi:hypothetical protein